MGANLPCTELFAEIHDRMPAILQPTDYDRSLSTETDPHDLLITYPSEPMTMRPISMRVNKPENDDPSILDRVADPSIGRLRWSDMKLNEGTSWMGDDPPS